MRVEYDPSRVSYERLVELFFKLHDPTTLNRQGNDTGSQYRSAIFYHSDQQRSVAEQVKERVQREHYPDKPIVTQIVPAADFYRAEDYHQK